jgi:hypothetical protein
VTFLTEKLSKLLSFYRQQRRPQNCPFQSCFTESCAVHSVNPTVSSVYLPTPRWHHLKALKLNIRFQQFIQKISIALYIHIYSFSNTTSYSTFCAFFSSFRITLWSLLPANSKRQPCFYPPQSHAQEDTQNCGEGGLANLM